MHKLEDFIKNNKEGFDAYTPSDALWHRLEKRMERPVTRTGRLLQLPAAIKWAAACLLAAIAVAAVYLSTRPAAVPENTLATTATAQPKDTGAAAPMADTGTATTAPPPAPVAEADVPPTYKPDARDKKTLTAKNEAPLVADSFENEALYQYARLVAHKQAQMKTLAWHAPQLYERFSGDLQALEYNYQYLKNKLDTGYNSEQVMQAMLQNLKLQSELLSKQLKISKKIKHKKRSHEKVYSL